MVKSVVIANGGTDSGAISIEGYRVFAIEMPVSFTGTTMTFKGSNSLEGDYLDVYDESGSQVSITVAGNRLIGLDASALEIAAIAYLKLVSGSAEGAERIIVVHMKD